MTINFLNNLKMTFHKDKKPPTLKIQNKIKINLVFNKLMKCKFTNNLKLRGESVNNN